MIKAKATKPQYVQYKKSDIRPMPASRLLLSGEPVKAVCNLYGRDASYLRYAVFEPQATPRGTALILQGRREFIEKKYFELGRDLLARHMRVIGFDWRGQGFSSRFLDGDRRQCDHLTNFDLHLEDLRAFYRDIVTRERSGPLFIFGHSMGGFMALRWLAENKDPSIAGAILTAPMLGLGIGRLAYGMAAVALRLKRGERYAFFQHDYNRYDRRFEGNVLTHDPVRFMVMEKYFTNYPELTVGGVSWGWIHAAFKGMQNLARPGNLETIPTPVLALMGSADPVTPASKLEPIIKRLPIADAIIIRGAKHDLMNEADSYREEAWRQIDRFMSMH